MNSFSNWTPLDIIEQAQADKPALSNSLRWSFNTLFASSYFGNKAKQLGPDPLIETRWEPGNPDKTFNDFSTSCVIGQTVFCKSFCICNRL